MKLCKHGIISNHTDEDPLKFGISSPYLELVGSLIYLMLCTRPDLSYSVGFISRYMSNPAKEHWSAATNILRYKKTTA
jgi:hypothetical protein